MHTSWDLSTHNHLVNYLKAKWIFRHLSIGHLLINERMSQSKKWKIKRRQNRRAAHNKGSYVYRLLEKDHIVQSYFYWKQEINESLCSIISRLRKFLFCAYQNYFTFCICANSFIIHYQRPMCRLSAAGGCYKSLNCLLCKICFYFCHGV